MILRREKAILKQFQLLWLAVFITYYGNCQPLGASSNARGEFVFSEGYLPKDLLITKSIVLIRTVPQGPDHLRPDWKSLAEEAHSYMKELGIDPVLYIYSDDIFSGHDVQRIFSEELTKRDVQNIIFLTKTSNSPESFELIVTLFNKEVTFVKKGQEAWKATQSTLSLLFRELARTVNSKDLVRENLLILDTPEYLREANVVQGRRHESFNTDLRIDKIAVPRFQLTAKGTQNSETGDAAASADNVLDQENLAMNADLEAIFSDYPYKYELVDYDFEEDNLRKKGFQFILMQLNTTVSMVRSYLNYKDEASNVDGGLVSVYLNEDGTENLVSLPPDQPVFKYYVKHIHTGDVYLGEIWDAAPTWQEALSNHLNHLLLKLGGEK